jgi:hypothetical protein
MEVLILLKVILQKVIHRISYKYVCLIKPLIRDRKAAFDRVCTKVQMEAAYIWTNKEWQSTLSRACGPGSANRKQTRRLRVEDQAS